MAQSSSDLAVLPLAGLEDVSIAFSFNRPRGPSQKYPRTLRFRTSPLHSTVWPSAHSSAHFYPARQASGRVCAPLFLPGKPLAGCVLLFSCSDASPSPRGCKLRVLYTSIILEAVTGVCFTTVQYIRGHVPRSANSITHCTGGDRRRRHHHHHHHHHDRHRTRKIDLRSASQAGLVGC